MSAAAAVVEAGVDTWKVGWYARLVDDDLARHLPHHGPAGSRLSDRLEDGHRLVYFGPANLLVAEGHPAEGRLAAPSELPAAEGRLAEVLDTLGITPERRAGVGRLDATVTCRLSDPRQGPAFLSALAHLNVPRTKPAVYGSPAETTYLLGRRSGTVLARFYDKGVESGSAPRGALIRAEDQRRYRKDARLPSEALTADVVRERFRSRFDGYRAHARGVRVQSLPVITAEIAAKLDRGEMSAPEAERLLGYVHLQAAGATTSYSPVTLWRRRRELRDHGLVLVEDTFGEVEVDIGELLDTFLEAEGWDG